MDQYIVVRLAKTEAHEPRTFCIDNAFVAVSHREALQQALDTGRIYKEGYYAAIRIVGGTYNSEVFKVGPPTHPDFVIQTIVK